MKRLLAVLVLLSFWRLTIIADQPLPLVIKKDALVTNVNCGTTPTMLFSNTAGVALHAVTIQVTNSVAAVVWGSASAGTTNLTIGYMLAGAATNNAPGGSITIAYPSQDARPTWWGVGIGGTTSLNVIRELQ